MVKLREFLFLPYSTILKKNLIRKPGLISLLLFLLLSVISCDIFEKKDNREVVARVNDSYLYKEDIASLVTENTSSEDSALIVSNYITRWATQK